MNADPRLLRAAPATRVFIALSVALGTITALLLIAQAWLLADVVSGAFVGGEGIAQLSGALTALLGVVLARAAVAWAAQLAASRSSTRAKSQLRAALLRRTAEIGLDGLTVGRTAELETLATRGIDALDGYFALYLPQLCLAVIVPAALLVVVAARDWVAGAIIAGTLPLIPLFMALVGAATRQRMDEQFRTLQRLSGHFLDVVTGLPTLKVFGRAKAQISAVGEITNRYRRTAMATLRISFLSSLILELVATISVALVAVAIGLQLMGGEVDLRTALFVLVLAPEAYLPLRQLGANYHASAEGMAAAQQVFALLDRPRRVPARRTAIPNPAASELVLEGVTVTRPGRARPVLEELWLTVEPGEIVAVTGPSGCGKSTLVGVLLGLISPSAGCVRVGDAPLAELDLAAWHRQLAWVPQRPHLFASTIADNVRVGRPRVSRAEIRNALAAAGLSDAVGRDPAGLDRVLGERGAGLSAGERQRVALARAFLRDAPLLLLDEPTANLDGATEALVLEAVRALLSGRTAVVVTHRPAVVALADRALSLGAAAVAA